MADWDYSRSDSWSDNYPQCNNQRQSPINIDTSTFDGFKNRCDIDCRLSIVYVPSKCNVTNVNNTPTIYFNSGSFISFNKESYDDTQDDDVNRKSKSNRYRLKKATIHTSSMHTINNESYDMEVLLYHYKLNMNEDDDTDDNNTGGVILSLLYKIGNETGTPNEFFSQIINRLPTKLTTKELNIKVNDDWGSGLLLPKNKSFFTYDGSLPFPKCNQDWFYVVFEEVGVISKTLLNIFKEGYSNNNRKTQRLNGRSISYNSNPELYNEAFLSINTINETMKTLKKEKKSIIEKSLGAVPDYLLSDNEKEYYASKTDSNSDSSGKNSSSSNTNKFNNLSWYKIHKLTIKSTILLISSVLFIMLSYFVSKYLITSNILPNFLININPTESSIPSSIQATKNSTDNSTDNSN